MSGKLIWRGLALADPIKTKEANILIKRIAVVLLKIQKGGCFFDL